MPPLGVKCNVQSVNRIYAGHAAPFAHAPEQAPHADAGPRNAAALERRMMTKIMFALSLGFGGLILATQAGHAAAQCGPRAAVLAALAERYGETRHSIGVAANNAVMEVFASEQTGTWTITVTQADGMTCLAASGDGFETLAEALPPGGDPA